MNELLNPTWKDISRTFETDFQGMTVKPVSLGELLAARDSMLKALTTSITEEEKNFLLSVKSGEPEWALLGVKGVENLAGLQWKLANVRKMEPSKRKKAHAKLKSTLSF